MSQQDAQPDKPVRVHIHLPISEAAFWRELARDPGAWERHRDTYRHILSAAGRADRETLRQTLNWLELAISMRARTAVGAAGRLLNAMPLPLLADDFARIMGIFNSRILGMVWRVTPDLDVRPLPPAVPRFGDEAGYGLIRSMPELYLKLAELAPEMEEAVIRLTTEALRYGVSLPPALAAMAPPPAASE